MSMKGMNVYGSRQHPTAVFRDNLCLHQEHKARQEVRHSRADIGLARRMLRFEPGVRLEDGLKELV
jgi:nucleoside-diphosphate-sugar epimerase